MYASGRFVVYLFDAPSCSRKLQAEGTALADLATEWRERHRYLLRLLAASSGGEEAAAMHSLAQRLDFNGFYCGM